MLSWKRLLLPTALILAVAFLAVRGNSGIWDPWEMNRAHVARTLAGQPKVLVVDEGGGQAVELTSEWGEQLFFVPADEGSNRLKTRPKGTTAQLRALKKAETKLKAEVFHAVLVDTALLLKSPPKGVGYLDSFVHEAPGATIYLIASTEQACTDSVAALEAGMVEQAGQLLRNNYRLLPADADLAQMAAERAGSYPFTLGLDCLPLDQDDSLSAAFAGLHTTKWLRVQYKGQATAKTKATPTPPKATCSVPPLDYWLTAASYKVFGFSETSSRLPFLLLGLVLVVAFALFVRRLWDSNVAALGALVLITLPLFLGQAKNMAGEVTYSLFLLLSVLTFATMVRSGFSLLKLLGLLAAALALFLAKGLFGLLVLLLILAAYVVLTRDARKAAVLAPLGVLTALFAVLVVLVQLPSEWTFFDHFKFMNRPFMGGPWAELRTFDYFVRQLAFAALPWTLILPFTMVRLLPAGEEQAETPEPRLNLLVFLWFAVPFAAHTAVIPDFVHLVFPASAAIALSVALAFRSAGAGEKVNRFQAVVAFGIAAVLLANLFKSPQGVLTFLTTDPHFGGDGGQKFPADFSLGAAGKGLIGLAAMLIMVYYARGGTMLATVLRFFQKPKAFWIGLWAAATLLVVRLIVGLSQRFGLALKAKGAANLPPQYGEFYTELFVRRPESLMLYIAIAVAGATLLLKYTPLGPALARRLGFLSFAGRWFMALLSLFGREMVGLTLGAALAISALIDILVSFEYPEGYFASLARTPAFWVICLIPVVAVAGAALWKVVARHTKIGWRGVGTLAAVALTLSMLSLTSVLFRLTDMMAPDIWVLTLLSFVCLGAYVLNNVVNDPVRFHLVGWGLLLSTLVLLLAPLVWRWPAVEQAASTVSGPPFLSYLLFKSRLTWGLVVLALLFVSTFLFPDVKGFVVGFRPLARFGEFLGPWNPLRWPAQLEKGPVFVTAIMLVALGFGGFYAVSLLPGFSKEVSQKHILQLYLSAEDRSDLGDDIFKYNKSKAGKLEDRNFYTSQIPALTNQQDFSKVLLAREDALMKVSRSSSHPGPARVLLQGYDEANDKNGDGERDWKADAGIATGVSDKRLEDSSKEWAPDEWKGSVLIDWRGNSIDITGNDATSLSLALTPAAKLEREESLRYIIDHPDASNHKASAMVQARKYIVLGQETFSSVNFSFRAKSGGLHIPVLEGSNVNFLLAASYLVEGEENHNRFAKATLGRESMDALLAWSASPGSGKFEEFGVDEELGRFGKMRGGYVNFEDKVKLLGYQMESHSMARNDKLRLRLFFEVNGKLSTSWKIFIHMDSTGASNRIHGDHWPLNLSNDPEEKQCVGCWRTNHWLAGDIIVDDYQTDVPLGSPSGTYNLNLGFYTPGSDKRLKVKDYEKGKVVHDGNNRVRIGTFEVH